jgi:uncharacterized RDD family membrane protein YckC
MTCASPTRRLLAWTIDGVVLGVVGSPLIITAALVGKESPGLSVVLIGIGAALAFAWLVLWDGSARGQTPGKRLLRIRVTYQHRGGSIGIHRAITRRIFSACSSALAGWWCCRTNAARRGMTRPQGPW